MGNNSAKESPEVDFGQLMEDSAITGTSWDDLANNIRKHIKNGKLDKEWEKLGQKESQVTESDHLFSAARVAHNQEKNRYYNILPVDATRVKLAVIEGKEGSDYINANFVDIGERSYICCQAPMENTMADFHRMIWETNTMIIVMLTRFVELGTIKALEYFPAVGASTKYGDISVTLVSEENIKDLYLVRKLQLEKGGEKRTVTQYHFQAWPDHGIPTDPQPLTTMITSVNKQQEEFPPKTPTIVHCSAGIGRTGTFVVVNTILEYLTECMRQNPKTPPSINLMKVLYQLRAMRTGMVTHKDQYEFCYKTILAHVEKLIADGPIPIASPKYKISLPVDQKKPTENQKK